MHCTSRSLTRLPRADMAFGVRDGVHLWADFQDYTHAAHRRFLELEAFQVGCGSLQDVIGSSRFVLVPRRSSQGLLVQNLDIFEECLPL